MLKVWIPGTTDCRDQGLGGISWTNSNVTNTTDGKLGKCLSFNGSSSHLISNTRIFSNTKYSVAMWVYTSVNTNNECLVCSRNATYGGFSIYLLSNGTVRFDSGRSDSNAGWATGYSYPVSTWFHLAVTCDDGVLCFYINGSLYSTVTISVSSASKFTDYTTIGCENISGASFGTRLNGKINDLRIYTDQVLSPREVKEISTALVLHYPLNRGGFGQDNLVNGLYAAGRTIVNNGIVTALLSQNLDCYFHFTCSEDLLAENDYTISMDVSGFSGSDKYLVWGIISQNSGQNITMRNGKCFAIFSPSSNITAGTKIIIDDINRTSSGLTDLTIRNIKVEHGSIPTPWIPNQADALYSQMGIDNNIVYDCSGYCNNGETMTDTITYSSDTPRYNISTHFNGTYDGIIIKNLQLSNIINTEITYSFWVKPENESGGRSVYFGSYSGSSWSIEKVSSGALRLYWNGSPDEFFNNCTITDDVWQHICITKSGTNDVKIYKNGVQVANSTKTHSELNFPTTYRIGRDVRNNDGTPYRGLMSDFRIYATALSADDILELYQTGASLSNNGTLLGYEYVET